MKKCIAIALLLMYMLCVSVACGGGNAYRIDGVEYVVEKNCTYSFSDMQNSMGVWQVKGQGYSHLYSCGDDIDSIYLRTTYYNEFERIADGVILRRKDYNAPTPSTCDISGIYVEGYRYESSSNVASDILHALDNMRAGQRPQADYVYECGLEYEGHLGVIYLDINIYLVEGEYYLHYNGCISDEPLSISVEALPRRSLLHQPTFDMNQGMAQIPCPYTVLESTWGNVIVRNELYAGLLGSCHYDFNGEVCNAYIGFTTDTDDTCIYEYAVITLPLSKGVSAPPTLIIDYLTDDQRKQYFSGESISAIMVRDGSLFEIPTITSDSVLGFCFADFADRYDELSQTYGYVVNESNTKVYESIFTAISDKREISINETDFICNVYVCFTKYEALLFKEFCIVEFDGNSYIADTATGTVFGECDIK